MEDRAAIALRVGRGRLQGSNCDYRGGARLFADEVGERSTSRAARSRYRNAAARTHIGGDGGGSARGRGCGHQDRGEGYSHRYFLLVGARRAVSEYDVLGGAHYAHSNQHGSELPG